MCHLHSTSKGLQSTSKKLQLTAKLLTLTQYLLQLQWHTAVDIDSVILKTPCDLRYPHNVGGHVWKNFLSFGTMEVGSTIHNIPEAFSIAANCVQKTKHANLWHRKSDQHPGASWLLPLQAHQTKEIGFALNWHFSDSFITEALVILSLCLYP